MAVGRCRRSRFHRSRPRCLGAFHSYRCMLPEYPTDNPYPAPSASEYKSVWPSVYGVAFKITHVQQNIEWQLYNEYTVVCKASHIVPLSPTEAPAMYASAHTCTRAFGSSTDSMGRCTLLSDNGLVQSVRQGATKRQEIERLQVPCGCLVMPSLYKTYACVPSHPGLCSWEWM